QLPSHGAHSSRPRAVEWQSTVLHRRLQSVPRPGSGSLPRSDGGCHAPCSPLEVTHHILSGCSTPRRRPADRASTRSSHSERTTPMRFRSTLLVVVSWLALGLLAGLGSAAAAAGDDKADVAPKA